MMVSFSGADLEAMESEQSVFMTEGPEDIVSASEVVPLTDGGRWLAG